MKQIVLLLLVLFALRSAALSEVPTSIFDDDWKPDTPQRQAAPKPPVAPVPSPLPTPGTPAPAPTPPTPDSAVAPSVAPVVARLAVPTAAAQADSWKLIKEDLYKDEIANAKTPAQKVELAGKLLAVAQDTNKDPVGKYVLLAQAKELAISSGDPPTAFKCLDQLGQVYDINYPVMKLELFAALAKTASSPDDCQILVEGLNRWADGQVKSDRYEPAKKACDIALKVARTNRESALVNQTLVHQKEIGEIETSYLRNQSAIQTLTSDPADPTTNLNVGEFNCFIKGDWDKGLPMLAMGSDAGLKTLAAKELAGVSGADAQVGLGDGWWALSEKEEGLERDRIREHAGDWYDEALPSLEGLAKAKVAKRLKEIEAVPGHSPRVEVKGLWGMEHGGLVSGESEFCRIEFPYQPPEEYDFRIVFTRANDGGGVNQSCTAKGRNFLWVIGAGTFCGFELVGGQGAAHNRSTILAEKWVIDGQEYTSVVKVRRGRVDAYLDGKLVLFENRLFRNEQRCRLGTTTQQRPRGRVVE
jgi:hypothetical protein